MLYEDKNIARRCKDCGEFYYLHPDVWDKDKSALMHLEYKYQKGETITPHNCFNNKPTVIKYNFEEQRLASPDEVFKKIKPNYKENTENNRPPKRPDISEHIGITKQFLKDMEEMRRDVSDTKMLLQAVIKIFDVATRKSNKQGDSLLFQKASSMVDEETTKRSEIEETKKVHTETDDVDDDDGNVPSETTDEQVEEEKKEDTDITSEEG